MAFLHYEAYSDFKFKNKHHSTVVLMNLAYLL